MVMSLYRTIKGHTGTYKRRKNRMLERSLGSLEATLPREMVSRRKILSRSRDDLNLDSTFIAQEEEEDVWYNKDKLYKEHIQEVLDKWTQIDDEIWAKVIVFERNRRVAKAYARAPVLTINGSDDGFDGMRIGLCGFDNPMRDHKTEEVKRHVGQGVKIKMDDAGNILIRRYSKSNVYVKSTASQPNEETAIGADIMKLPGHAIESEKIVKLFDMKKFQSNVNRELRRAYPDRRRLETQCLSAIAFVKSENEVLDCPVWVLIINVVAMDMLKSKLPPDDPYYCGLRARVPNFVKSSKSKENNNNSNVANNNSSKENAVAAKRLSVAHLQHPASLQSLHQLHQMHPHHNLMAAHQHHQQLMWHARSYESGIDTDVVESPYSHMYGRVPLPTRGYIPAPRAMYIGEWD
ncbi:uncharacterized protein LOC129767118 [Toxorhynchites rutilus septentrionalis]|uniref:uncharacterized protein LOC129767118 n=1 Tax=Toxorhynchites rutilus septentrionalis TaxID=329112 RepID=UPI00247B050D|nr:uncharacterized protein LOC129767118 [Toxorhynchites rutilus septentrionalis]